VPGAQFNLQAWLESHGARRAGRGQQVIVCPTCGKRKLPVDVGRGIWHCWVCQKYQLDERGRKRAVRGAGDLVSLLQVVDGLPVAQAIALAESVQDVRMERAPVERLEVSSRPLAPGEGLPLEILPPPGWSRIDRASDWPYLRKRGLADMHVRWLQLVVCTEGEYAGRLVFPVLERGRLVYWQARAMWEAGEHDPAAGPYRKALNPPRTASQLGASDVLLNLDVACQYPRVAIVEGPVDVAHAGRSAVGTFGKRLTLTQLEKLRAAGVRAIDFMWDGPTPKEPEGAWPEMLATAPLIQSVIPDVRLVRLPYGDPGTYSEQENNAFRACALPAGEFGRLIRLG